MKKSYLYFIFLTFMLLTFTGCGSNQPDPPEKVVENFLKAVKEQNFASAKTYYSENLDNMANFRNQVEDISPSVATALFKKLGDFTYTVGKSQLSDTDSSKATVEVTLVCQDLGKTFETTVLDYIRTDLEMTFDGAKSDDIVKETENLLAKKINESNDTFTQEVTISLTKENDTWKLDKISENPDLLNALSGNIIYTIDALSKQLETLPSA